MLCPGIEAGTAEHPQQWCSTTVLRGLGVHPRLGWAGGERFLLHLLLGFSGSAKMRSLVSGLSLLPEDGVGYALSGLDQSVHRQLQNFLNSLRSTQKGFTEGLSSKGGSGCFALLLCPFPCLQLCSEIHYR